MQMISPMELQDILTSADDWALFDVRETPEADAGHIFGATFLPRRMLELRLAEFVPAKATTVVFYDEGGTRAILAAQAAARAGYTQVRVLRGGTAAWRAEELPLTQGSNVPSKLFGEKVFEEHETPRIAALQLQRWQRDARPHIVCDIRTPEEYRVAHVPGAWGAFGVDVALHAGDLIRNDIPVVVHCAGRTRSIIACQTLRDLGVANVFALENGTMGWTLAGLELERDAVGRTLQASPQSVQAAEDRAQTLAQQAGVRAIDVGQLRDWIARRDAAATNLYVFDVRQVPEYIAGHVPGSKALPGGLAIQRTDEFIAVKNARIVLIDDAQARAWITAYWLRRMGFPNVDILLGGLAQWRDAGNPVETGRPRATPLLLGEARGKANPISAADLRGLLEGPTPPMVIDVDTSRHYSDAHVPGAQWLPYGWLESRIDEHVPDRDTPIVISCHNGVHSTYAAANLVDMGFSRVRVLDGGVALWRKAAFPVEQGLDDPEPNDIVVPPYASDPATMARYLDWEQKLTTRHAPQR